MRSVVTDDRYIVSEWAFYRRSLRDLACEVGFATWQPIDRRIYEFLWRERPGISFALLGVSERRRWGREILGEPVPRRQLLDLGDLWIE
jgi:hypothetical protein